MSRDEVAPTVSRRILAARLRRHRKASHLTLEQVSKSVAMSVSKISRMETNERAPVVADVAALAKVYRVPTSEADDLIQLAHDAQRRSPYRAFADSAPERDYFELEAAAHRVCGVNLLQIHGLLQTPAYTRALLAPAERGEAWLEQVVRSRAKRQERLLDPDDLFLTVVLGEAALESQIGTPADMVEQLAHLLTVSRRPNVDLRIVPFAAGATPGHAGSFQLLTFRNPELPPMVYLEGLAGQVTLQDPDAVATYETGLSRTRDQALPPSDSRAFLELKQARWEQRARSATS